MAFNLPPKDKVTPKDAKRVFDELTSEIATHPRATTTYLFYEDIDAWLGPWGADGYPIGYGKFYNLAFTGSPTLMADSLTRDWVGRTTVILQEAIRDYVVERVRAGTIGSLTEEELREAAFDSHPIAYTQAGLDRIMMLEPWMALVVGFIPAQEFIPFHGNAFSTYLQVFKTLGMLAVTIAPTVMGGMLPNYGRTLGPAFRADQSRLLEIQRGIRLLGMLQLIVDRNQADLLMLDRMAADLSLMQFPNQELATVARSLLSTIDARRAKGREELRKMLKTAHPRIREKLERMIPGLKAPPAAP